MFLSRGQVRLSAFWYLLDDWFASRGLPVPIPDLEAEE